MIILHRLQTLLRPLCVSPRRGLCTSPLDGRSKLFLGYPQPSLQVHAVRRLAGHARASRLPTAAKEAKESRRAAETSQLEIETLQQELKSARIQLKENSRMVNDELNQEKQKLRNEAERFRSDLALPRAEQANTIAELRSEINALGGYRRPSCEDAMQVH